LKLIHEIYERYFSGVMKEFKDLEPKPGAPGSEPMSEKTLKDAYAGFLEQSARSLGCRSEKEFQIKVSSATRE
jgi:hypothetical protein